MSESLEPYSLEFMQGLVRREVRRAEPRHKRWRVLQALYRTGSVEQANQFTSGTLNDLFPSLDDYSLNLVLPHLNVILASVIARDPKPLATPYGGGERAEAARDTAEGVMGYWWHRLRATRELRDATQDAVFLGKGILKTGWRRVEDEREPDELELAEGVLDVVDEDRRMRLLAGEDDPEPMPEDEAVEVASQPSMQLLENAPYVEYVSPFDFFVPDHARRLEDARWMVHRVTVPVDEVVANPAFGVSEDDVIFDQSQNVNDRYQAEWARQAREDAGWDGLAHTAEQATLYEFYDMRTRRLTVFQLGASEPLFEDDFYWAHAWSPFVEVSNYRQHGNDFWGFGDLENLANAQSIFNEMLTEQVENAQRAGTKFLSRKGTLDDTARSALESPQSDTVAEVTVGNGERVEDAIFAVPRPGLSSDVYALQEDMQGFIQNVLGINEFQAGGMGADRMSATAAAVVDGVATLRAQDKIAAVEEAASEVASRLLLLSQEFMDEPTAVRISGQERPVWERVSRDDLYGEFLVQVESGSTKAVNPATREQQGMRTLGEVVPLIVEFGYDPTAALRQGLRDLGHDPDVLLAERLPPPEPAAAMPGAEGEPVPGEMPGDEEFLEMLTGQPSNGEMMMQAGGPPGPAEAQAAGGLML